MPANAAQGLQLMFTSNIRMEKNLCDLADFDYVMAVGARWAGSENADDLEFSSTTVLWSLDTMVGEKRQQQKIQ